MAADLRPLQVQGQGGGGATCMVASDSWGALCLSESRGAPCVLASDSHSLFCLSRGKKSDEEFEDENRVVGKFKVTKELRLRLLATNT